MYSIYMYCMKNWCVYKLSVVVLTTISLKRHWFSGCVHELQIRASQEFSLIQYISQYIMLITRTIGITNMSYEFEPIKNLHLASILY